MPLPVDELVPLADELVAVAEADPVEVPDVDDSVPVDEDVEPLAAPPALVLVEESSQAAQASPTSDTEPKKIQELFMAEQGLESSRSSPRRKRGNRAPPGPRDERANAHDHDLSAQRPRRWYSSSNVWNRRHRSTSPPSHVCHRAWTSRHAPSLIP